MTKRTGSIILGIKYKVLIIEVVKYRCYVKILNPTELPDFYSYQKKQLKDFNLTLPILSANAWLSSEKSTFENI